MKQRPFGQSGIQASVIAFGAWAIGGWKWGGPGDENTAIRAIHRALEMGMNFIDTAPVYGFGTSEEIVGKALKDRRDKAVLATKCGLRWDMEQNAYHFSSDWDFGSGMQEVRVFRNLTVASIKTEVERSLKRLGTDYIDLLQTHWQDPETPIAETMQALEELRKEGKIRAIGASNANVEQLEEYNAAGNLDTDQERFSMLTMDHAPGQREYCARTNTALLAYSPLAQGLLTGKVGPDRAFPKDDLRHENPRFSPENRNAVNAMLYEFSGIAETHDLSYSQLTLAWTVAQKGCSHALAGARNEKQVTENAKAGTIELSVEELNKISAILEKHLPEIE